MLKYLCELLKIRRYSENVILQYSSQGPHTESYVIVSGAKGKFSGGFDINAFGIMQKGMGNFFCFFLWFFVLVNELAVIF
jgi:hypothetical protein